MNLKELIERLKDIDIISGDVQVTVKIQEHGSVKVAAREIQDIVIYSNPEAVTIVVSET